MVLPKYTRKAFIMQKWSLEPYKARVEHLKGFLPGSSVHEMRVFYTEG